MYYLGTWTLIDYCGETFSSLTVGHRGFRVNRDLIFRVLRCLGVNESS